MIRNGEADGTEISVSKLSRRLQAYYGSTGPQTRDGPKPEVTWRIKDSTWKNQTKEWVSV